MRIEHGARCSEPVEARLARVETGPARDDDWGVPGPIYFTIMKGWVTDGEFRPSDPTNAYFYDAYHIVSMTPDRFEYQSYASGSRYLLERGPDGPPNDRRHRCLG